MSPDFYGFTQFTSCLAVPVICYSSEVSRPQLYSLVHFSRPYAINQIQLQLIDSVTDFLKMKVFFISCSPQSNLRRHYANWILFITSSCGTRTTMQVRHKFAIQVLCVSRCVNTSSYDNHKCCGIVMSGSHENHTSSYLRTIRAAYSYTELVTSSYRILDTTALHTCCTKRHNSVVEVLYKLL